MAAQLIGETRMLVCAVCKKSTGFYFARKEGGKALLICVLCCKQTIKAMVRVVRAVTKNQKKRR